MKTENKLIIKTKTIKLVECKDGFWLWDETREMNLAMKAKTEQNAFIETIEYYQDRLIEVENNYTELKNKVDGFLDQFKTDDIDWWIK